MAATPLLHLDEYLRSSYEPDAEYVAGRVIPRATPQKPHSRMQGFLVRKVYDLEDPLGFEVWPEQRIQTRMMPRHYRIPDICITQGLPDEDIFTAAPFLCIEILSPEDSPLELRVKIEEYLAMGAVLRLGDRPRQLHWPNSHSRRCRAGRRRDISRRGDRDRRQTSAVNAAQANRN